MDTLERMRSKTRHTVGNVDIDFEASNFFRIPSFAEVANSSAKDLNNSLHMILKRVEVPAEVEAHFRQADMEWCRSEFGTEFVYAPDGATVLPMAAKGCRSRALESFFTLLDSGINVFTEWEKYGRRKHVITVNREGGDPGYKEYRKAKPGETGKSVDYTLKALKAPSAAWDNTEDGGPAYYRLPGTKSGKGVVKRASRKRTDALKALMAAHTDLMFFFRRPAGSENLDNLSSSGCTDMMRRLNKLIADSQEMKSTVAPVKETAIGEKWLSFILSLAKEKGQDDITAETVANMSRKAAYELTERLKGMAGKVAPITPGDYMLNGDTIRVVENKAKTGMYCFVNGVYSDKSREIIASLSPEMKIEPNTIAATAKPADVEPGVYKHNDVYYRVQFNSTKTSLYCIELEIKEGGEEIYRGKAPLAFLTADMRISREELRSIGRITVKCCDCGRTLRNKVSRENGIGPICEGR